MVVVTLRIHSRTFVVFFFTPPHELNAIEFFEVQFS
jgi:hypothetical protein